MLVLVVAIPLSVHAGVFSSFAGLWSPVEADVVPEVTRTEPYTASVLSAALNSDPQAAVGGGDVLVDDGALVSYGVAAPDDMASVANTGEISVYVVREPKPGQQPDTLSHIAEMFGVSVNTIMWANDITDPSKIRPGDTLVILPITGVRHLIKDGDTINSIAKKYEGDAAEILAYNQLATENELRVGETIVIPGGNIHEAAPQRTVARTATPVATSGATASAGSGLAHPVPGAVRTQGLHGYNAVDLAGPIGTPVRAAASGEVIVSKSSGWNGGYGNYIVVKHANGIQTLYAHLSSTAVGVGAYVAQGETIGALGNTGKSTGPHLHFEVRGGTNPF